ncbi:MAG: alpha/beta hydrolase [Myxococcota bacterium]|nr:alpha/beta hydrolase [Myxococcota bacterium]
MEPRAEHFTRPELGGVALHVLLRGDPAAPALVLLHGAGANAHWWDHLAPALAQRFRVAALDFRGHGDSDFPDELVPGAFGDDLEALLAHLDAPDAVLVGHSLGAHVALAHAARPEATTRALVLLDPARGLSAGQKRATRLALSLGRSYRTREHAVSRFRFLPGESTAEEALRAAIATHSVRELPDGRFGFKFDPRWFGVPARARTDPAAVRCPTLLLRGARSRLLGPEAAEAFAAEIPGCRLATIPDAGHHVHVDRPDATRAQIEAFLDEVRAARPEERA